MRSRYIYQIFNDRELVWSGTVKYEAHRWLTRSEYTPEDAQLFRVEDGGTGGKVNWLVPVDWDFLKFKKNRPDWTGPGAVNWETKPMTRKASK
jgi:hypothetical protein